MPGTLAETLPEISHGDHCCLFFSSPAEQARVTAPFLATGLDRGERSVYVGDPDSVEAVREGLKSAGVGVAKETAHKRLVITSDQDYLDGGRWKSEKMLGFLQVAYDSALSEGFTALRAAGDVSWQVGPERNFDEIVYYEALLDLFFTGKRMVGLCEYPKDKCPPETLNGILNTHKIAAIDSNVCSNFHYFPPELLLEKDGQVRQMKRVEWMTSQLLRAKKAEEERDAAQRSLVEVQKTEAVGRLAGGVAHDFNNILTAILGLSEFVLARKDLAAESRADVEEIKKAGERAATLTRQLLTFSRRQAFEPRVIDLNGIVRALEPFLRRLLRADIELRTVLGLDLGNVKADPGQLEQVIMNLVVNARDAMPQGGALSIETDEIELNEDYAETHPGTMPGPHVMLAISDTGVGMDAATQARIFEPFFTTKEKGAGTGLGLATVHGIISQSGGSILVHSETGKGSTFKVCLPRAEGPVEAAPPQAPEPESLRGKETALLVEEDNAVRTLVHRTLATNGYTVLTAISSIEAIKFCERHKGSIHVLIANVVLPGTTGHELARQAASLRPKMKFLFMSGGEDDGAPGHKAREGRPSIKKPFTPEALLRRLREVLFS